MEYAYSNDRIKYVGKRLTVLDKLVIDFLSCIDSDYVIVSGYIAILFGMDRHTEDIDIFMKFFNSFLFMFSLNIVYKCAASS